MCITCQRVSPQLLKSGVPGLSTAAVLLSLAQLWHIDTVLGVINRWNFVHTGAIIVARRTPRGHFTVRSITFECAFQYVTTVMCTCTYARLYGSSIEAVAYNSILSNPLALRPHLHPPPRPQGDSGTWYTFRVTTRPRNHV